MQVLIALDQLFNAILNGWADETLSARCWRLRNHRKQWAILRGVVDALFFWQGNHCEQAYQSEVLRLHSPPSERKQ